ncbi:MAG: cupin domain-containing protein [Candidatus Baltobacteraceae bacterium]
MATKSTAAERKSLNSPDERRPFPKGSLDVVSIGTTSIGRGTFEPGWKWSECVKPIAGTQSCLAPHLGYVVAGRMKAVMDDGQEIEFGPGDAMLLPPGHDAWVVGEERCVVVDFGGYEEYAKPT